MRLHDELSGQAANRAHRPTVQRATEENEPKLLKLQRSSGNTAVTELVQRDKAKTAHKLIKARIIGVQVKDGKTYITIGSGTSQGVTEGMKGWVVNEGGHRLVSFDVDNAAGGVSHAYVEASIDEINQYGHVELDSATAQPDWRKLGD